MKTPFLRLGLLFALLVSAGAARAASESAPPTVIHVVTVAWKPEATPEQIQAALDGVKALPAAYPGIVRVWVRSLKVQNPEGDNKTHAFVMEFADEGAFKAYSGSEAQKKWYEVYLPIRARSTTHDITN